MDRQQELLKILGSQTSDKAIHAQAILSVIDAAESRDEKVELLEIAITKLGKVDKHPQVLSNKGLDPGRWDELNKKLTKIVNDHVRNSYFSTASSKSFANELLRLLEFYPTPDEKTFCLGTALYSSDVIPYHNLPGDPVTISSVEFAQLLLANADKKELMEYLVNLPFYDWTQAVSQVLQVIDDTEHKKLRIALLAWYMITKIKAETDKAKAS